MAQFSEGQNLTKAREALAKMVYRMLVPVSRLFLRTGLSYQVFSSIAKRAFVQAGEEHFQIEGKRQTKARLALITGLTRPDVRHLVESPSPTPLEDPEQWNRALNVLHGWRTDAEFMDNNGQPRELSYSGDSPEFAVLVRKYGADIPMRTILDELRDKNAARLSSDRMVCYLGDQLVTGSVDTTRLSVVEDPLVARIAKIVDEVEIIED